MSSLAFGGSDGSGLYNRTSRQTTEENNNKKNWRNKIKNNKNVSMTLFFSESIIEYNRIKLVTATPKPGFMGKLFRQMGWERCLTACRLHHIEPANDTRWDSTSPAADMSCDLPAALGWEMNVMSQNDVHE